MSSDLVGGKAFWKVILGLQETKPHEWIRYSFKRYLKRARAMKQEPDTELQDLIWTSTSRTVKNKFLLFTRRLVYGTSVTISNRLRHEV